LGKFILTVASTTQLYVEPIPLEGAVRTKERKDIYNSLTNNIYRACLKKLSMENGSLDIMLWVALVLATIARILVICLKYAN
jgi:hypothetical protein